MGACVMSPGPHLCFVGVRRCVAQTAALCCLSRLPHPAVQPRAGRGGVAAALTSKQYGVIDNWLRHIKDVYRLHKEEIDALENPQDKENRLVELNVVEGVFNVCKTTIVQNAWESGQELSVHGWVVDIHTGLVKDQNVSISNNDAMDKVYQMN